MFVLGGVRDSRSLAPSSFVLGSGRGGLTGALGLRGTLRLASRARWNPRQWLRYHDSGLRCWGRLVFGERIQAYGQRPRNAFNYLKTRLGLVELHSAQIFLAEPGSDL